jgi:hypothetical protein
VTLHITDRFRLAMTQLEMLGEQHGAVCDLDVLSVACQWAEDDDGDVLDNMLSDFLDIMAAEGSDPPC